MHSARDSTEQGKAEREEAPECAVGEAGNWPRSLKLEPRQPRLTDVNYRDKVKENQSYLQVSG